MKKIDVSEYLIESIDENIVASKRLAALSNMFHLLSIAVFIFLTEHIRDIIDYSAYWATASIVALLLGVMFYIGYFFTGHALQLDERILRRTQRLFNEIYGDDYNSWTIHMREKGYVSLEEEMNQLKRRKKNDRKNKSYVIEHFNSLDDCPLAIERWTVPYVKSVDQSTLDSYKYRDLKRINKKRK